MNSHDALKPFAEKGRMFAEDGSGWGDDVEVFRSFKVRDLKKAFEAFQDDSLLRSLYELLCHLEWSAGEQDNRGCVCPDCGAVSWRNHYDNCDLI